MHELYELKEMLMKELEEYGRKGEMSTGSLEVVDKLAHAIKNICKVIEAYEEEEYSMNGGSSYERGSSYRGGSSYDGAESGQSRRGRGSSRAGGSSYRGGISYARGGRGGSSRYSMGNEDLVSKLEEMMEEVPEQMKSDVQRLITKMESM